jgi:hypothetical protein
MRCHAMKAPDLRHQASLAAFWGAEADTLIPTALTIDMCIMPASEPCRFLTDE